MDTQYIHTSRHHHPTNHFRMRDENQGVKMTGTYLDVDVPMFKQLDTCNEGIDQR